MCRATNSFLLVMLLSGLLLAVPAFSMAQDAAVETPQEQTPPAAPGISTLIFLLGAGAIIVVGGAMFARDSFQSDSNDRA